MKKKISLILALVLTLSLFAMPAAAAADQTEVENTIRALGIMTGDEKGRMNLSDNITRAEFVKLAVNASVYKDTAAEASGYSLFKDVKSSHWASPSVKIAVDNGWVTGYSDGTFRPDKGITLEEAATLAVRMLGYTQADLVGAFPDAQLAKYRALGLDANVTATRGQTVTRRDCMNIFYNMLTADTKQGTAYATTLGYRLDSAGEMNYTALVNAGVEGPAILKSGSALAAALPFTTDNMTVYRNGSLSTAASAQAYDVCYYHKNLRTVWLYSKRVTGTITSILPNSAEPASLSVAGADYALGTAAAYKVSDLGTFNTGDSVTLLFGRDGAVCDIMKSDELNENIYGMVISSSKSSYTDAEGKTVTYNTADVVGTDGSVRTYSIGAAVMDSGVIVEAGYTGRSGELKRLTSRELFGNVSEDGTVLANYAFADDIEILDTGMTGAYAKVTPADIAGATLGYGNVRFYALNEAGKIYRLILCDVTGCQYTYGLLTSVSEVSKEGSFDISGTYSYIIGGKAGVYSGSSVYGVTTGGAVFYYGAGGQLSRIRNLKMETVDSVNNLTVISGDRRVAIATGAQIYLYSSGEYIPIDIGSITDAETYRYVGYIDSNAFPAGGKLRILIATKK